MLHRKYDFHVRKAVAEDAAAMARIQRAAVKKAWREVIQENFDSSLAERFDPAVQEQKYRERVCDPARILCVVETKEEIVGFGGAREHGVDESPPGFDYQGNAFYIDPAYEGTGASKVLLSGILSELQKRNAQSVVGWCLAGNRGARNFYERRGGRLIENAVAPAEYDIAPHVAYGWVL